MLGLEVTWGGCSLSGLHTRTRIRGRDTALGTVAMICSFSARSDTICFAKDFPASSGIWYQLLSWEFCPQGEPPLPLGVSLVRALRGAFSDTSQGLVESLWMGSNPRFASY